ncbi:kinase-like domain-containing protein [Gigaspora rosea]|uniref:Kinase-like domain-containing protein n=1 Tax=Gigaspora rosea TaxID=44941 RepID=A0A397W349_9GLOM|nr:kinase-like domain-containing protein [Gigaspora rosea]
MSSSSAPKKYPEWLKQELNKGNITFYYYSQFNNVKDIGKGGFGLISSADYNGTKFALKNLNTKEATREFVNELKQLRAVEVHPNINQFYGITTDPKTENLMLVLQYANEGNLRQYLRSNWHDGTFKISLREIIKIAKQVTLGLIILHKNNIIHCDLHPKNILINNGNFLIADFGLARKANDSLVTSLVTPHGSAAYVDPQCYEPGKERDEKSDVYSLGTIFWELTSGTASFEGAINSLAICVQILKGYRHDTILGTPHNFAEIYKKCWDYDPQKRPTTNKILETLDKISKEIKVEEFITNSDQRPIPILTRNGASNLFPVGLTVQTLNDPGLKNPKQTSPDDAIESNTQVITRYKVNSHKESLKINLDDVDALKSQGLIDFKQKNYKKLLEALTKLLSINNNDLDSLISRGQIYYMLGRYKESLEDLDKLLTIEPNNAVALRSRGQTLFMLNRYEKSLVVED